jgi:hypothetical protein
MSKQTEFLFGNTENDTDLLLALLRKARRLLVKKLSNNDRDWARFSNKHQAGVYIPHEQRDSGFFPELVSKERADRETHEIREAIFTTLWPQMGNEQKSSRLVHYTSKGQETHLTRVPKALFADLLPASFLIIGAIEDGRDLKFECLTIDSGSDDAVYLAELLDIGPDFLVDIFDPSAAIEAERGRILDFADQVISAWMAGDISSFATANASMPATADLALIARTKYMQRCGRRDLNPFEIENPGDALRDISRGIEWDLFRDFQRRERAVALVRLVMGDAPVEIGAAKVIRSLVDALPEIDRLMLSASQQRKSRAGYSYEHHIEAMLRDGSVPFEKQVIIEKRKRPDFVLPSLAFLNGKSSQAGTGLILSAKTTLRERWKQVEREKGQRDLFLTTVDENIAGNAIEDMASFGVCLVIPESLKRADESEYKKHKNVLSFREFCDDVIKPRIDLWG